MSGLSVIHLLLAAAFCVGVGVFYRVRARGTARAAGLGWMACAGMVLILIWASRLLDVGPRAVVFTGLILPVWLGGGLVGLLLGRVLQREGGP